MTDSLFEDSADEALPLFDEPDAAPAAPAPEDRPDVTARWQVKGRNSFSPDKRRTYMNIGLGMLGGTLLSQKPGPLQNQALDAWLTLAYETLEATEGKRDRQDLITEIYAKTKRYESLLEPLLTAPEQAALTPILVGKNVSWKWDGDEMLTGGTVLSYTETEEGSFTYQVMPDGESEAVELAHEFLTIEDDDDSNAHLFNQAMPDGEAEAVEQAEAEDDLVPAGEQIVDADESSTLSEEAEPVDDEPEPVVEPVSNPGTPKKSAFTSATNVIYDPSAEPIEQDQYTINVHLVLRPKAPGKLRQVAVSLSSHGLNPVMHAREVGPALWNELPGLIAEYQASLPTRKSADGKKFGQPGHLPSGKNVAEAVATPRPHTPAPKPEPKPKKSAKAPAKAKAPPPTLFT